MPAASEPRAEPLFAVAGGPGDASTTFFAWLPGLYEDVHAMRDIVLVDQRGTGASDALVLGAMPDTSSLTASEADARLRRWIRDSLDAIDADPRFYTTTVAADDLDDVRAALGYDQIDLYGTSYGGTLVQYYIRQHPEHVRVAVLDGATPLDVPVRQRIAVNSQRALDLLLKRCQEATSCHSAFPDIAEEWSTLEAGLAKGMTTTVVDPETGAPAVADLGLVGPSLHAALLTGSTAAALPLAIHLAHGGRWDELGELVQGVPPKGGPTLLMADENLCSEAWARFDPAEVAAVGGASYATAAQLSDAEWYATRCRYLPKGVVPADDGAPVVTDIPMLWLTADGDPGSAGQPGVDRGTAAQQPHRRHARPGARRGSPRLRPERHRRVPRARRRGRARYVVHRWRRTARPCLQGPMIGQNLVVFDLRSR